MVDAGQLGLAAAYVAATIAAGYACSASGSPSAARRLRRLCREKGRARADERRGLGRGRRCSAG